ncbi:hypothetical protein [Aquimarina sediminis]|uniref:hypothetical protein n=1 Tax=Aquimarina sediminis TaxID=2070536 RepID=UPI000FFF230B|nr:hypothetical protein [Aquimarina sediminis]
MKFEDKVKEKLEQRVMEPSKESWGRLTTQLDDAQNQKKKIKKIWKYVIAASFVGILVITSIVVSEKSAIKDYNPQMVDNKKEIIKTEDVEIVLDADKKQKLTKKNHFEAFEDNPVKNGVIMSNQKEENDIVEKVNVVVKNNLTYEMVAKKAIENKTEVKVVENNKETIIKDHILPIDSLVTENKVAQVVAQIKELQKNQAQVTDLEINELLLAAQREIKTEQILKSNTVSAASLLQDVEEELDETFKQRVFEALKTGFYKVKTAVVRRDN